MRTLVGTLLLASVGFAAPKPSATLIKAEPEQLAQLFKEYGTSEISKLEDGSPRLFLKQENGFTVVVDFYDCDPKAKKCQSLTLDALYEIEGLKLDSLNKWNANTRYGKGFVNSEGLVVVEHSFHLGAGLDTPHFDEQMAIWWGTLESFEGAFIKE